MQQDAEILAYLNGAMSPEEEQAFEQRLEAEPALAEKLDEALGETRDAVEDHLLYEEARAEVDSYYAQKKKDVTSSNSNIPDTSSQEEPKKEATKRSLIRPVYAVAASLAILCAIWFPLQSGQLLSKQALYVEVFAPEGPKELLGADDAHIAYQKGDFEAASQEYRSILTDTSLTKNKSDEITFFLGQSLMEQAKFSDAEPLFAKLKTGEYEFDAEWNRALCLLMMSDSAAAHNLFNEIAKEGGHEREDDARKVLKKWKRLDFSK